MDALHELSRHNVCDIRDRHAVEKILKTLIHRSIEHARNQVDGRNRGTMTFDDAMGLVRNEGVMVTRPSWSIFCAVRTSYPQRLLDDEGSDEENPVMFWRLDNCDGVPSGNGWPFGPSDEDRAATDWMLYQRPQDNWVELDF